MSNHDSVSTLHVYRGYLRGIRGHLVHAMFEDRDENGILHRKSGCGAELVPVAPAYETDEPVTCPRCLPPDRQAKVEEVAHA